MERACAHCGDAFTAARAGTKFCSKACSYAAWYLKNKDACKAASLKWRKANLDRYNANQRAWRKANPDKHRNNRLRSSFGVSLEEYLAKLAAQGDVCAICLKPETCVDHKSGKIKALAVDHDHETGRVRGLLCSNCNTSLKRHLTPVELRRMADYLERA